MINSNDVAVTFGSTNMALKSYDIKENGVQIDVSVIGDAFKNYEMGMVELEINLECVCDWDAVIFLGTSDTLTIAGDSFSWSASNMLLVDNSRKGSINAEKTVTYKFVPTKTTVAGDVYGG